MSEAARPKYDNLPGIDTAPDIYETPELAEDVSTIQASTVVSESDGDDDNDPNSSSVNHQRFQTGEARSRFQPSRVDARGVDFSDNVAAQRRSYRTTTRARRRGEVLGDDSEDEKEDFSKKLNRLKRELFELDKEYQRRLDTGDKSLIEEKDPKQTMEALGEKMDEIYTRRRGGAKTAEAQFDRTIDTFKNYKPFEPSAKLTKAIASQPPLPGTQIQKNQLDYVLGQAAEFDKRITQLENSLGLNGNTMPELSSETSFPVYTTLQRLEQTLGLIGDASTNNLDMAFQQIKKLAADAEQLKEARLDARNGSSSGDAKSITYPDQEAKVNALYGTLPSIDKLSPVIPLILERLRTLRLIHTSAWQADEVLSELEKRQSKQEDEIKMWEKQLVKMEGEMEKATKSMHNNMKVVGDDVKRFEERLDKLFEGKERDRS